MTFRFLGHYKGIWPRFLAGSAGLALLMLALSFILPGRMTADYYGKSLGALRDQAQSIKKEFADVLKDQSQKLRRAAGQAWPETTETRFKLFKGLGLDPEVEGIAAYTGDGRLTLWLGNVVNLEAAAPGGISDSVLQEFGQTLLIKYKASSYLVSLHWVNDQTLLVLYRLLAFIPEFKSPYLDNYHFISPRLRKNCSFDYWDFRDDVSVVDKNLARHQDEYIGQPRLQGDVLSLFFPFRNERNQILATVSLRSPTLAASLSSKKEFFLSGFYAFFALALLCALILLSRLPSFRRDQKLGPGLAILAAIAGLRFLFFPISRLEQIQAMPLFSPTSAGFFSIGNLTKSPGDIFLTSLAWLAAFIVFSFCARKIAPPKAPGVLLAVRILVLALSIAFVFGIHELVSRLASNAGLNLLKFDFTGMFFILHISIVLCLAGCVLFIFALLKSAAGIVPGAWPTDLRRFFLWATTLAVVFFLYGTLHQAVSERGRSLTENFLKNTILSQEDWARFILDRSFQELDKQQHDLLAYLKNPERVPEPTHAVWKQTLAAKFNWYSSLEIQNAEGATLSRFSLNVPKIFRAAIDPSPHPDWTVERLTLPFMGKEKDFLLGFKDWIENGAARGRTVFYLSLDYDMLPFLYSANPYFELLRVNSLQSLNAFDIRMAVFDPKGKLLFNPNKISTALPPELLSSPLDDAGRWTAFTDKGRAFRLYAFPSGNRIYALFSPEKGFIQKAIDFFKLLFLYIAILLPPIFVILFIRARKKGQHPLWSFANRVYISFIAVSFVPLFLFTFFSRSFFTRVFTQQFIEKAEIHASMARSVMDDYNYYIQRQDKVEAQAPPEDLMLWISTAIANDVNLYREGRLVSSSRSEFFDQGLFPELIDGEIYYKIQFENNPFYTQKRNIGNFSFQTLTVPYASLGPRLMISLPFPFEQEEISGATQELVEFFLFISILFVATVIVLARGIGAMIVNPIHKLLAGTKEASLGNLDFAIEYKSRDEMKTLIDGFNAMIASLKDHQQELADLGKKAAWAEMARKVAHEIKNPLTPIQLSAEHLLRVYEDKGSDFGVALRESISYISSEVENLRRIAQEFLEISREAVIHREPFGFDDLVRETVDPYRKLLAERIQIRLEFEGSDFRFEGDRAKLKIALRNILTNAIESIRGKGEIGVRLAGRPDLLVVEIKDTGAGIEKDILDRIFEPYFSTKDVGTGLGLPIAKKIIEDHQGSIEIASEGKKGTKITIRFRFAHV